MDILLIGHDNKINNTIIDILSQQSSFRIERCSPDDLEDLKQDAEAPEFDLLIADLTACDEKPADSIANLKKMELAQALLAIHIYNSTKLMKPLLQAGADGYLPSATTEQEMLTAIEAITNGEKYPDL